MKLRKFAAVSLSVAMVATMFTGCGNEEKESKDSNEKSSKESTAESFTDAIEKASKIKNYDYEMDMEISLGGSEVETMLADESAAEILDTLGIDGDEIKVKVTFDGKVKGEDAYQMAVGYEFGKFSGELTEVVYVDDMAYINIADIVDLAEQVGKAFDVEEEISTYTTLIPEGDYIAISKDSIEDVYDAVMSQSGVSLSDIESMDEEKIQEVSLYLLEEVEKIAKAADGAYSTKDGYTITVNQDNLVSVMGAFIGVFAEDGEEIIEKIESITGDLGVSADELNEELKETDMEELESELESEMEDFGDFEFSMSADCTGKEGAAVCTIGYGFNADIEGVKMNIALNCKITENDDVSIKAPSSVMAEEDLNALLSLAGYDSMDDLIDEIVSASSYSDDYSIYDDDYYEDDYDDYYEDNYDDLEDYDFN